MIHSELVKQLVKPGDEVRRGLSCVDVHLMHMSMGISGEAGEIIHHFYTEQIWQNDALVNECGDVEFYIEGYKQGLAALGPPPCILDTHRAIWKNSSSWIVEFVSETSAIIEFTKKYVIYHKRLNIQLLAQKLENIHSLLNELYLLMGVTREYVLDRNVIKLTKRYDRGYSDAAAIERVDVIK